MQQRSIAWLREQELNKRFLVCEDRDRAHVADPDFEGWIDEHARKTGRTWWGDGFETYDHGFSFCNQPTPWTRPSDDPFPFVKPIYTRYSCPWENVTAIYEARGGYVYIFTSKEKQPT